MTTPDSLLNNAQAWPYAEARRVINHIEAKAKAGQKGKGVDKGYVLFESGYGPSGLPHLGTFGEVFRTTVVRRAFERLMPGVKTRLFAFSDDMDGLRKVPTNVPNQDLLKQYIAKPLTKVPDPFGTHPSFGEHNNAMLRKFLDEFEFEYEFCSSTDFYHSGKFNKALLEVLAHHDAIRDIIVPTLGEERAATYSPFLPISQETGNVLYVPVIHTDVAKGTIVYRMEDGREVETPVTDGHCKLQWKPDWGMRWHALDVDYEMSGKDLIDSVNLASKVCRELGSQPPVNLTYEHFVDENGAKISKSKGNGISIEEWLSYAPANSLSLYMYRTPTRAKKLYRTLIPTVVEEYAALLDEYPTQSDAEKLENPVFHIHNGQVPANPLPFPYGMLLNLASVTAAETADVVWRYVQRYKPELTPENTPQLDELIKGAIRYYTDTIKPTQTFRGIENDLERDTMAQVKAYLSTLSGTEDAETIQTEFYEIGKRTFSKEKLRDYFRFLYQALLGFESGPRLGSFTLIYGVSEMLALITKAEGRTTAQAA